MPEFADPWALLLLPLPVAAILLLPPAATVGAALRVPDRISRAVLDQSGSTASITRRRWVLPALTWCLLVIAIAGPRQLVPTPALPTSGRDLVLALDLSGSMVRDDFFIDGKTATRLEALKHVGASFVRRRGGDRVGLVVFGSNAYVASPLTFDVEAVAQTIEDAVIGISGRATNISDALGLSLKRLSRSEATSRVVILLSDGANNAGAATPRGVAKLARDMGVRVHTIAMGPKSLADAPGERGVVDVATLQAMSDLSGGQMFRVRTTEDLETVTRELDKLEATQSAGLAADIYRELWLWPALLALGLSLLTAWKQEA